MSARSFAYRALNPAGAMTTGELHCVSRAAALDALSQQGLIPVDLEERASVSVTPPKRPSVSRLQWRQSKPVTPRELLALTQSLASLLNAGLMIDRALIIASSLAVAPSTGRLTESLLKSIRAGLTLAQAFAACGQPLPPYYVSMVDAGEVGGSLPATLTRLTELQQRNLEVRERIRSALVYPSLLAGVMMFTVIVLLTFVLPRFEQMFAESEAPLPFATQVVLGLGRFTANYWWLGLLGAGVMAMSFFAWLRSPRGRRQFDGWLLQTRLALGLPAMINTARLLRTVSTLTKNGLPLPAALRVARGTLVNQRLLEALTQVTRGVQAGDTLSQALTRAQVFPPVAVQLARVGEETGHLDEMLLSASAVLEEESRLTLERLLTLIVPLLTITMGLIVAGLIGSVLIGLLSINDLAF